MAAPAAQLCTGPRSPVAVRCSPALLSSRRFYDQLAPCFERERTERRAYLTAIENLVIGDLRRAFAGPLTLIDLGCGDGARSERIARATAARLVCVDHARGMVARARARGLDAHRLDIARHAVGGNRAAFDAVTLLWNVLGHIPNRLRPHALSHVYALLDDDGVLMLDVNNLFNAAQYGAANVATHRRRMALGDTSPGHGDFVVSRWIDGREARTVTHLFGLDELCRSLERARFAIEEVRFVHYDSGGPATEETGQILVRARKARHGLPVARPSADGRIDRWRTASSACIM